MKRLNFYFLFLAYFAKNILSRFFNALAESWQSAEDWVKTWESMKHFKLDDKIDFYRSCVKKKVPKVALDRMYHDLCNEIELNLKISEK